MRPQPKIKLQGLKGRSSIEVTVTDESEYWIVVLDDKPINIITQNLAYYKPARKYSRTGGTNRAAIQNIADRLNQYFKTDRFTVKQVI